MPTQRKTTSAKSRPASGARSPRRKATPRRTRSPATQSPIQRKQVAGSDFATALVRLAVGAVSLGSEEVTRRLAAIPQAPESRPRSGRDGRQPGNLTLGSLGAGVAIESAQVVAQVVARLVSTVGRGRRFAGGGAGRAGSLPVVGAALGPLRRGYDRYEATLRRLSQRGREEEQEGRRMVELLIRETTTRSVMGIAEFAVNEVTHSPEVAALVRNQSTGLATDTILEVRANSEQADDRLERRVHSWLHLRRSNGTAEHPAQGGDAGNHPGT